MRRGNESAVQAALAKFNEVAQITHGFARPHCGIAQCYGWLAVHGASQSAALVSLARAASERAVELDPEMSQALAAVGSIRALEWNWNAAETSFKQAMKPDFSCQQRAAVCRAPDPPGPVR